MGHLGHVKEEYRALVDRLDQGTVGLPRPEDARALAGWTELLEIFFSPEEAAIAARMPMKPASLERVAGRLGMSPEQAKARLEPMCDKGLVMDIVHPGTKKTRYMLAPPVVGFFEFSMMRAHDMFPKARLAAALDAYMHGDPAFASEVFGGDTVVGRALVDEDQLHAHSAGDSSDVLDWERSTQLIAQARSLAVSLCYCRHKNEHLGKACDAPQQVCLSLDAGADFVARRGFGRTIERQQAMDILVESRRLGLVQIADNVQKRPTYLCNCCGCCCGQLSAINEFGLRAVNPSGFEPTFDADRCKGCSRCSRACPIAAITMVPQRSGARRKNDMHPQVDTDRCIGCGVCAGACRQDAVTMQRGPNRPVVPLNSIEKTVRMMIERGRLADLIVDRGDSWGAGFLNRVLDVLLRLPPTERLAASRQVQSRFVRFALANVRDPTGG